MQPEIRGDVEDQERARRRRQRSEQVQRRRVALGIVVLGLIVLIIALVVGLSDDEAAVVTTTEPPGSTFSSGTYSALLTGPDSVPPVRTVAEATFDLTYDAESNKLTFVLKITKQLTNPRVAAIYQGGPGTSGDAVYTLYAAIDPSEGTYQGTLAEGTIVEMDLIGPLEGETIEDLLALIEDGDAYVSIGNKSYPVDAIRGQIEKGGLGDTGDDTATTVTTD